MLEIKDLSLAYTSGEPVIDHVNLSAENGEITVLLGTNGSGKTTLLRGISGMMKPQSGTIMYNGRNLAEMEPRDRARLIAVVPQAAELPAGYTVFETVSHGRTPYLNWCGMLSDADREIISACVDAVGLDALQEKEVRTLSGGEQQRVVLARALAQTAPILALDEPTSFLDLHYQVMLLNLVRKLCREKNLAVLAVLHDLNLAVRYADKAALIHDGKILAFGDPKTILNEKVLSEVYQTPIRVWEDPTEGMIILPSFE